jgi:hypothetical protein
MDTSALICVVTPLFLFGRKFYRIFSDFEVRLWSGRSGNVHAGTGVGDELDETQRVLLFLLGLLVEMGG